MKITQHYPFEYFAKATVDAGPNEVRWHYKSITREFELTYSYSDLDPKPFKVRQGSRGSGSFGLFSIIVAALIGVVFSNSTVQIAQGIAMAIVGLLSLLAGYCALLQLRKQEFVYFSDKGGKPAFFFNAQESPEMAEFLEKKIAGKDA